MPFSPLAMLKPPALNTLVPPNVTACWPPIWIVRLLPAAVAFCDICTWVSELTFLMVVPAGMPGPLRVAPTSAVTKCACDGELSLSLPGPVIVVIWPSVIVRGVAPAPEHATIWIVEPRSLAVLALLHRALVELHAAVPHPVATVVHPD